MKRQFALLLADSHDVIKAEDIRNKIFVVLGISMNEIRNCSLNRVINQVKELEKLGVNGKRRLIIYLIGSKNKGDDYVIVSNPYIDPMVHDFFRALLTEIPYLLYFCDIPQNEYYRFMIKKVLDGEVKKIFYKTIKYAEKIGDKDIEDIDELFCEV